MKFLKPTETLDGYGYAFGRIFSVVCTENNKVVVSEECRGDHTEELSTEDAIELFQEVIDFLKWKEGSRVIPSVRS